MLLVAVLRAVLADPDLLALHVRDHAGRDGDVRRARCASRRHRRREERRAERLALTVRQPVHEQLLALADAILLSADGDDRVGAHRRRNAGLGPASRWIVAITERLRVVGRRAIPTSGRTRPWPARRRCLRARALRRAGLGCGLGAVLAARPPPFPRPLRQPPPRASCGCGRHASRVASSSSRGPRRRRPCFRCRRHRRLPQRAHCRPRPRWR